MSDENLLYGGICPVCGDEYTDGLDRLSESKSFDEVRLCVVEKDENGDWNGLFHLPDDQGDDPE